MLTNPPVPYYYCVSLVGAFFVIVELQTSRMVVSRSNKNLFAIHIGWCHKELSGLIVTLTFVCHTFQH